MMLRRRDGLLAAMALAGAPWARAMAGPPVLASDFDPTDTLWLSYAPGHEALTRGLVAGLRDHVRLRFLVADESEAGAVAERWPGLPVTVEPQASFFLRDVAVFTRDGQVVDFRASQDGAPVWCARRYTRREERSACISHARRAAGEDDGLDRAIAGHLGLPVHATALAMEGGGIESNGRGLLICNEALWRSRNPQRSRLELERELRRLPGVIKPIWLPEGLAEDVLLRATITGPYVAWGTGGHTDEFVRFADERTVLLAWPDPQDRHPVSRLSARRMARNHAILADATDTRGRRLRVIKVPMPRIVQRRIVLEDDAELERSEAWRVDYFPAAERRRAGDVVFQVATATYLNFAIANGGVVLPDYGPHGTPAAVQDDVARLFESVFPGRRIAWADAISANWVGGGLHCATLNQP